MKDQPDEITDLLRATLDDRRLSRNESRTLAEVCSNLETTEDRLATRRTAFAVAREALADPQSVTILEWLQDVLKVLERDESKGTARPSRLSSEAWFSPDDDCAGRIVRLIDQSVRTLDVCVFTITDDRITDAILRAHLRGVFCRVATDDDKAEDLGSDIHRLREAGLAVRMDRSPFHMHHKFALFDRVRLLTGSYNWTRGAARDNEENLLVTSDPVLIDAYSRTFEQLWKRFS